MYTCILSCLTLCVKYERVQSVQVKIALDAVSTKAIDKWACTGQDYTHLCEWIDFSVSLISEMIN